MPSLHLELKQAVLSRQREYKIAAIHAKQSGDIDQAKQHYLTAKVTEPMAVLSHEQIYLFVYVEKVNPNIVDLPLCRSWTCWWRHWTETNRWT